jgi:hypothetical protein
MNNLPQRRPWFLPRASTVIFLALVAAMFAWGCFAQRGAAARDCWLLSLLGLAERSALEESAYVMVYVRGLPFAYFVDREWGGWPRIGELFWLPLLLDFVLCGVAVFVVMRAWRWWLAPDGGRRKLRFHLSTAVMLMFVAALALWANMAPSYERTVPAPEPVFDGSPATPSPAGTRPTVPTAVRLSYDRIRYYGWPLQFWETDDRLGMREMPVRSLGSGWFGETRDAVINLVYDVVSALAIVLLTGVICEARIAWRAKIGKERATS